MFEIDEVGRLSRLMGRILSRILRVEGARGEINDVRNKTAGKRETALRDAGLERQK